MGKGPRAKAIEKDEIATLKRNLDDEIVIMEAEKWEKVRALLKGSVVEKSQKVGGETIEKGTKLSEKVLETLELLGTKVIPVLEKRGHRVDYQALFGK